MRFLVFVLLTLGVFLVPRYSYAIIFIPALILIPIAKILAVLIAGFSVPAIGVGALWSRMNKRPWYYGVIFGLVGLVVIAFIVGVVLKVIHPERPLY